MADPLRFLTTKEAKVLRDLIQKVMRMPSGGPLRYRPGEDTDILPPETYLARTPAGGIAALDVNTTTTGTGSGTARNDDVPGEADCALYQILDVDGTPTVKEIGVTRTVYNYSTSAIPGRKLIAVTREKFGRWLALEPQGISDTEIVLCKRVVSRVYCSGGVVYYDADFWYINNVGQIVSISDTPCDSDETTGTSTSTSGGLGNNITLTVATVTNGVCSDCTNVNGTYTLEQVSEGVWTKVISGSLCGGTIRIRLQFLGSWTLHFLSPEESGTARATYVNYVVGSLWDGSTSMTLTYYTDSGACTAWPASITVTPV